MRDPDDLAARAFRIFAALWAIATLFHQIAYPAVHVGIFRYVLSFAALAVLLRPSSVGRLLTLAVIQTLFVAYHIPNAVTNHWLFTTFVNLTILVAGAHLLLTTRRFPVDGGALLRAFAPAVRIEVVILYFYAVLHKLNHDFLNPATSCAVDHYTSIALKLPFLPTGEWVNPLLIYGTLVLEGGIPLLLLFQRTRIAGLLLGMGFHFLLALNPDHRFYNFSAMIYALYFLFLPYDYLAGLRTSLEGSRTGRYLIALADRGQLERAGRAAVLALAAMLVVAFVLRLNPGSSETALFALRFIARSAWVVYGTVALSTVLLVAWRLDLVRLTARLYSLRLGSAAVALVPLLVFANGLSPYLGLKTETSFSMFSNLRTEAGQTNHLFIPNTIRLTEYQDDLVEILEVPIPWLQRVADDGRLFTFFELRRIIAGNPDLPIAFIRNGEQRILTRAGDDPELATHHPAWLRAALAFRPVEKPGAPVRCHH